jgi:transposase-like protein
VSVQVRFSSAILPPYARRSKSLEVLIPILYLKGVSTGDFEEALIALLGKDAGGLSASTISRLKEAWAEEHARWSRRDHDSGGADGPTRVLRYGEAVDGLICEGRSTRSH